MGILLKVWEKENSEVEEEKREALARNLKRKMEVDARLMVGNEKIGTTFLKIC